MVRTLGELHSRNGDVLLKMWQVSVEPGKRVLQRHNHMQFEIVLVNSGSGKYTTNDGVKDMEPGDMFVFASNEFHCITEVGETGLVITNLHFEPRYLLADGVDSFSQSNQNFCFAHAKNFGNKILKEDAGILRDLFCEVQNELTGKAAEYPVSVRALLNLMAVRLIRNHGYSSEQAMATPQLLGVLQAMSFIDAHLEETLTLSDISAAAGVSPNYFSTLFKRICHIALWDYITAKRVEKAIRLICGDFSMTMLEIALSCGFNNTANFNKAFRKQTGMTPTDFRNAEDPFLH
jgi:AraC-like DNA-binding protein/quercetin dioxygenase-like cupin family protein